MRILLIEDEEDLARVLRDLLQSEHHEVITSQDGNQGLQIALSEVFDVIILDLMLPGMDGHSICTALRQSGILTPILILTAKSEVSDKVLALTIGADDYLVKPIDGLELLARLRAVSRRIQWGGAKDSESNTGCIRLNSTTLEAIINDTKVALTTKEFDLLQYFIRHHGVTLTRDRLLKDVWRYDASINSRTVDVFVVSLRQKLQDLGEKDRIITVHGTGYRFV